jgi:hypothetical protein
MASRSKLYFTLALCFNCFIITFLILDSRSISGFDMNLDFLPTWNESWAKLPSGKAVESQLGVLGLVPETKVCGMCTANSTLCEELG